MVLCVTVLWAMVREAGGRAAVVPEVVADPAVAESLAVRRSVGLSSASRGLETRVGPLATRSARGALRSSCRSAQQEQEWVAVGESAAPGVQSTAPDSTVLGLAAAGSSALGLAAVGSTAAGSTVVGSAVVGVLATAMATAAAAERAAWRVGRNAGPACRRPVRWEARWVGQSAAARRVGTMVRAAGSGLLAEPGARGG